MRISRFALVVVLLAGLLGGAAGCGLTFGGRKADLQFGQWSPGEGWVPGPRGSSSPTAAAMRAEARKAFDAGAHRDALRGLLEIQRAHPDSAEAKEAQTHFLIAECYLYLNDYDAAYKNYLEVTRRRPSDEILNQALSRIYHIGLAYLKGKATRSFVGLRYRSSSYGVEILLGDNGLVTRYPFLSFSDDALMEIARYYYDKKEYPEAEQVFERLVRDYPDREWYEIAEYQLAVTVFNQVRGVDYDQAPLRKARLKFDLYRHHHPRGDHIDQVRDYLRRISEMEAQHDLKVAKYYLRESRPEAAMYYLRSVLLNNPNTDAAREAREMFTQMSEYRGLDGSERGGRISS